VKAASGSSDFLAVMARTSRRRWKKLAVRVPRSELEARARALPPPLPLRTSAQGFDVIAEIKFASPSSGALAHEATVGQAARLARSYSVAGAAALSVLTEPRRFAGSIAHLCAASRWSRVPVLRKDFLVDALQVLEARAAGASGVLLVLRLLDAAHLDAMLDEASTLGLFALLEAFDERDLERAAAVVAARPGQGLLVGVNARDLATLAVDPARHRVLAPALPRGVPCVAESGLASPDDARAVAAAGYRLALVGSALQRAPDANSLIVEMIAAGRAAASTRSVAP